MFALSAIIPPNGDNNIVGIVAIDNIVANMPAEPLCSKIYIDKASFNIKLPNNEIACPNIKNIKRTQETRY